MATCWYLYILRCADGSLYTGITTDLERRTKEHNEGKAGARYTKTRRPVELIYSETADNRSVASKREATIKKMSRREKLNLLKERRQ